MVRFNFSLKFCEIIFPSSYGSSLLLFIKREYEIIVVAIVSKTFFILLQIFALNGPMQRNVTTN